MGRGILLKSPGTGVGGVCGLSRAKEEERAVGKSPLWWAKTGGLCCGSIYDESDGKDMNACLARTPRSGTLGLQGQRGLGH